VLGSGTYEKIIHFGMGLRSRFDGLSQPPFLTECR